MARNHLPVKREALRRLVEAHPEEFAAIIEAVRAEKTAEAERREQAWRDANRERVSEYNRRYYLEHRGAR